MSELADWIAEHATDLPCPEWCEQQAGHPLFEDWPGAELSRFHTRTVAVTPFDVTLEQYETALTADGPTDRGVGADDFGIRLSPDAGTGDPLTGPQARVLAAALLAAADAWDRGAAE